MEIHSYCFNRFLTLWSLFISWLCLTLSTGILLLGSLAAVLEAYWTWPSSSGYDHLSIFSQDWETNKIYYIWTKLNFTRTGEAFEYAWHFGWVFFFTFALYAIASNLIRFKLEKWTPLIWLFTILLIVVGIGEYIITFLGFLFFLYVLSGYNIFIEEWKKLRKEELQKKTKY